MAYLVNVDIGGTHTDGVAIDEDGRIIDGKVPSTPNDFAEGFFDSLELMAEKLGLSVEELLSETELVSHGTTVGTNAVIEDEGADAALVTTRGAESTLSLMRGAKGRTSGLTVEEYLRMYEVEKPEPLVPASLTYGMDERVDSMGEVVTPFQEERAREIARELDEKDVDSVALSFLWSFLNDDHERKMASVISDELGDDVFLTRSSDVAPTWGEYERTAATAINAIIGPTTSSYIETIDETLAERGYDGQLLVMKVEGGVAPASDAISEPVRTIDSGPAAGIMGCQYLAGLMGHEDVIAADMGGTSFDVGLITDGIPITRPTNVIKQYDYSIRNIDIESIGNGGGSIAWVEDETDRLKVGPQSAGADPGPACYDNGGESFTVTDADLLCDFIDPDQFLGGRTSLNRDRAEAVAEDLADRAGMDLMELVRGVVDISDAQMADLISQRTINKGHDPREFTIYAYGGAGPLHLPSIAHELDIDEVVVPAGDSSAVWSAAGISSSDVLYRTEVSNIRTFAPFDPDDLTERFEELESEVRENLREAGFEDDETDIERYANISYGLQVHEVTVPVPSGNLDEEVIAELTDRFEEKYADRYGEGAGASETGFELVNIRCDGYGTTTKPNLQAVEDNATGQPSGKESIFWPTVDKYLDTTVYYQSDVAVGQEIDGPAVLRLENTTVTVPQNDNARIDEYGNIVIRSN
jgi:N-methylhydantoinase A